MGTIIGDEKDTSVQFTVIANWSSFPSSSQPWFMNIDLTGSLFVFSEVCAIILAGIQGANDQIENSNREGDSFFSTRDGSDPQTCRKLGKCEVYLLGNVGPVFFSKFFVRVFWKVMDLARSLMKIRIVVKNLWNSVLIIN